MIVSPMKNEEKYVAKTLDSVVSQTVLPVEWMIVNDGSTDNSEKLSISTASDIRGFVVST